MECRNPFTVADPRRLYTGFPGDASFGASRMVLWEEMLLPSRRFVKYAIIQVSRGGSVMGMLASVRRIFHGSRATFVDYEAYQAAAGAAVSDPAVLRRVGPGGVLPEPNTYKLQQSYDSLLKTVQELRAALDGQVRRQEQLLSRLGTLPQAVEALPQTSQMQAEMLQMINDRLALHLQRQRQLSESMQALTGSGHRPQEDILRNIREQIETSNEIDRQLVESFNRFSMMIDRLQAAHHHAVDCLQQVRDSYAASALQMHEWIEKSRNRNTWMLNSAFVMALVALLAALLLLIYQK